MSVELPPAVSFQTGAELLVTLGIVQYMTHQGVRFIAANHPDWPFGIDRSHPYWEVSGVTIMATEPFLEFFRKNPPTGRGPDLKPRKTRRRTR